MSASLVIPVNINNIVATVNCRDSFDLPLIASELDGSIYDPDGPCHWLRYRLQPNNRYIAIYKSGKFLVTGCKTLEEMHDITERMIAIITRIQNIDEHQVVVQNIVVSDFIKFERNLDHLYFSIDDEGCQYEPEQFPALMMKGEKSTHYLLFPNGKIVCVGSKTVPDAMQAIKHFKKTISMFNQ